MVKPVYQSSLIRIKIKNKNTCTATKKYTTPDKYYMQKKQKNIKAQQPLLLTEKRLVGLNINWYKKFQVIIVISPIQQWEHLWAIRLGTLLVFNQMKNFILSRTFSCRENFLDKSWKRVYIQGMFLRESW